MRKYLITKETAIEYGIPFFKLSGPIVHSIDLMDYEYGWILPSIELSKLELQIIQNKNTDITNEDITETFIQNYIEETYQTKVPNLNKKQLHELLNFLKEEANFLLSETEDESSDEDYCERIIYFVNEFFKEIQELNEKQILDGMKENLPVEDWKKIK
jgi:hypothetical protein